ncbi:unnamed protein product [Caenorhabditis auriculariae]|uniref:Uncharacterized protein n=1 Tax=Caenorhabditis auriculariae TaxID=2777116 RepID=A0A8S1HWI1_9PELO|nr:unnamed protein product [Caenorhabditis auriculariae]
MLLAPVLLLSCQFWIAHSAGVLPKISSTIDPNTALVIFGTRHGNRNPYRFLPQTPQTWGFEGSNELTNIGKRQSYGLGSELRKFIGNLTSKNYNASEVVYYSSPANRCQMTLQVLTAGLHPPETWAEWNKPVFENWSPVPYTINDAMLRMYSVSECKKNAVVWKSIDNEEQPQLKQLLTEKAPLLAYFEKNTGWNMSNLLNAQTLADNVLEMCLHNAPLPDWITAPTANLTSQELLAEIMSFSEAHEVACANYPPCRDLMAGYWLSDILSKLNTANKQSEVKLVGYSSHSQATLSIMKLLGMNKNEVRTSAGFVIEFRKVPYPSVRLLNHDPNPIDTHVIYPATLVDSLKAYQDADGFINLATFSNYIRPFAKANWKSVCGITPYASPHITNIQTIFLNTTIFS